MPSYLGKRELLLKPVMDKRARLELQVVETQAALESLLTRHGMVEALTAQANTEVAEIEAALAGLDASLLTLDKDHDALVEGRQRLLHAYDEVMDRYIQAFQDVEGELTRVRLASEAITTALNERQKVMDDESHRLATKEMDLKVYEGRLQKKIDEAGLGESIKLIFTP